ncbi:MAG: winged helix-turn-helix domain-containing protein [Lachnospiraceae bacterium]
MKEMDNNDAEVDHAAEKEYHVHTKIKITVSGDDKFLGPGVNELLGRIEKTGSLQEACAQMQMSYTKGSRMVKNVNRELGVPAVERWIGGVGGGGSRLTKEGKELIENYQRLVDDVQRYTEERFQFYFGRNGGVEDEIN